jgi:hypothetical protein
MLSNLTQELMTPQEVARWFRRSPAWLRHQPDLIRLGTSTGQPLFHVAVCRAWVLGRFCRLTGQALRRVQLCAMAAACGISLHEAEQQACAGEAQEIPDPSASATE